MPASAVVFDIDGLSIRAVGSYGNVELQTPMINEFSAQSRVFEHHYRALLDSRRDRDLLYATLADEFAATLFFADTATESGHEVTPFESIDELTDLLEDRFDTEDQAALIRLQPDPDRVDESFPLSLITRLIEAEVDVVVTSTNPLLPPADYAILNEEAIRVPLMIWSASAERVQAVTSHVDLVDLIREPAAQDASAVIRSDEVISLRESDAILFVARELVEELSQAETDDLASAMNVTDERIQLFRKPADVWNVHNVLVEDIERGVLMLSRLRQQL